MIDIETEVLTLNGSVPLKQIDKGTKVFGHHDDLKTAQIGTQAVTRAYRVILSDRSHVVVDKSHKFGDLSVGDMIKDGKGPYRIPQPELIGFYVNVNLDFQDGVEAIFNVEGEHLPHDMRYGSLDSRERVFVGMQDGFRDAAGLFIATVFSETYAEDLANFCRSLGHDAEVIFTHKGIRYWNVVIRRGPRQVVEIESIGKKPMIDVTGVVTKNYIAV